MRAAEPLHLREALRAYWYHLAPLFLMPAVTWLLLRFGSDALGRWFLFSAFFPCMYFAAWPAITGRAKQSFTAYALGLYPPEGFWQSLSARLSTRLSRTDEGLKSRALLFAIAERFRWSGEDRALGGGDGALIPNSVAETWRARRSLGMRTRWLSESPAGRSAPALKIWSRSSAISVCSAFQNSISRLTLDELLRLAG
jgi:hypothetical protein